MKVSDLMSAMSAAGAPMEAILIAVRALEERDEVIAQKRAIERDRKRRQRGRDTESDGTVTGQSRDSHGDVPATPPPPPFPPKPPKPTPTPVSNKPARKGTRLSPDWQPELIGGDLGEAVSRWPESAVRREMDRFRDWAAGATGPNALKLDWQAAWRNWLRKAEDEGRYAPGQNRNRDGPASHSSQIAGLLG